MLMLIRMREIIRHIIIIFIITLTEWMLIKLKLVDTVITSIITTKTLLLTNQLKLLTN